MGTAVLCAKANFLVSLRFLLIYFIWIYFLINVFKYVMPKESIHILDGLHLFAFALYCYIIFLWTLCKTCAVCYNVSLGVHR